MGLCYRHEIKLPLPATIKLNLLFQKQEPLNKYESRSIDPEKSDNQDSSNSDNLSENNNYQSSYSSYSKSSCYESKNNGSSYASSSQFKSSVIYNSNDPPEKNSETQNITKKIVFPIQVSQDNNEDIENLSDDDAAEYSKASSYHTLTQQSRKSIKFGEKDIIKSLQSQEKISKEPSKTLKSGKSGKSLKTFKSLDQLERQEDPEDLVMKKTIKTIAEKAKANQFVIVVTDETSKKDLKYMMVNVKEQNMVKIQEDEDEEEEECKLEINDIENQQIELHPMLANKNQVRSEELQEIHYDTEQTIKTFESFYQTIKQRNSEKQTEAKVTTQKKSAFSLSSSKQKDIGIQSWTEYIVSLYLNFQLIELVKSLFFECEKNNIENENYSKGS